MRSALLPLTLLYRFGLALRERSLASGREPLERLRLPVLSIGNLSTGGTGKTPLTIALARALTARGVAVDVLSRGYGRTSPAAARVDPARSADDYGDEPLLIARSARVPVYVAPQRYDAGLLAEAEIPAVPAALNGHDFSRADHSPKDMGALAPEGSSSIPKALHILDDGFQHRQLHRDVNLLLVSRADLSDRLLPAGNLREPLRAIERADVVAVSVDDPSLESSLHARGWSGPIWRIRRRMEIPPLAGPILAFCGIARPEQFFAGLESAGIRIAARRTFRDHHRYTQADLDRLAAEANKTGATLLLTTEKDAIRLERLSSPLQIHTVKLSIEIEDEPASIDWLLTHLPPSRS